MVKKLPKRKRPERRIEAMQEEAAPDMVNHPSHYGGDTPYEVIKVLEAWLTPEEYEGFLKGNIIKYNARARKKGGSEDIKKAQFYTNKLVDFYGKKNQQSTDAPK